MCTFGIDELRQQPAEILLRWRNAEEHALRAHVPVDESVLEAHGNVVTQDESGEHKAPSMTFYVHDGQAILMHQDR